jgi:predicted  nucleic acid-binding Zn-ribbon protein
MKKKYQIKTACPQCGCSEITTMTSEEIRKKYGDMPNVEMECGECMKKYSTEMKDACPEWDAECKIKA